MNQFTAKQLLAAWREAQEHGQSTITLTHASAAGMLIDTHRTLEEALAEAERRTVAFPWWVRAAHRIRLALEHERGDQAVAS